MNNALMANLHYWTRTRIQTQIQTPNAMATLFYTESVLIAQTGTRILILNRYICPRIGNVRAVYTNRQRQRYSNHSKISCNLILEQLRSFQ